MVRNFIKELYMQLKSWILGKRVILTRSTNDWRAVKQTCDAMNAEMENIWKQIYEKKKSNAD